MDPTPHEFTLVSPGASSGLVSAFALKGKMAFVASPESFTLVAILHFTQTLSTKEERNFADT
ncbi:MAG: hypothetical protein WCT12_04060 [Verrucomicrobiota bacterium]|jgi:phosphoketolase